MYRTRRMRNRRSGRSKRGGETIEKKGIKLALGITPETRMVTDEERKAFNNKLLNPEIMGQVYATWDRLGGESVYNDKGERKLTSSGKYELSRAQQKLKDEFGRGSTLGRWFTKHPERVPFYDNLFKALETPDYMEKLVEKIEANRKLRNDVSSAMNSYDAPSAGPSAGVEQQPMRKSAAEMRAERNDQPEIRKTTDADAAAGVGSAAVLKMSMRSPQVVKMKETPQQEFDRKKAERAEKAAAAAAEADRQRQEAAAAEAAAAALAAQAAAPVLPPPALGQDTSGGHGAGKSRRRHRRSHRRSNKKSRKGRMTRKSHRRHKGGRR